MILSRINIMKRSFEKRATLTRNYPIICRMIKKFPPSKLYPNDNFFNVKVLIFDVWNIFNFWVGQGWASPLLHIFSDNCKKVLDPINSPTEKIGTKCRWIHSILIYFKAEVTHIKIYEKRCNSSKITICITNVWFE